MWDASLGKSVCDCGCGGLPRSIFSNFLPGHNTRVKNPMENPETRLKVSVTVTGQYKDPVRLKSTQDQLLESSHKRWSRPEAHDEASETTSRVVTKTWSKYTPEEKEHRLVTGILSPESLRRSQEVTRKGSSAVEDWLFWHLESDFSGIFKFNRNREKQIGTKYPDFYSDKFKLVIESFGYAWHSFELGDDEQRIEFYKNLGWTCLVIWADDDFDVDLGFPKLKSGIESIVGKA